METANDSAFMLLDFANGAHAVVHVGAPNIVGPGLRHTGQTVILSRSRRHPGDAGRSVDRLLLPVSEILGFRRGADAAEPLTVPESEFGVRGP